MAGVAIQKSLFMSINKKILVIAPAWVGDVVMSQSLIQLLKQKDPVAAIDVLAKEYLHPILKRMPEVRNCLVSPFEHGELNLRERFKIAKDLRKNSYTHAYIIPNSFKSALIPFWAKIPRRVGWCGEQRYFFVNDMRFYPKKIGLMVERFVSLGYEKSEKVPKDFPRPKLGVSSENVDAALKRLQIKPSENPILAVCPGAEHGSSKRWSWSHFAEVSKKKLEEGWEVWILGSKKEQEIAKEIQKYCDNSCVDLTGKTDLGEVIDLISMATAVVANDSGLMHIAAALDRPVVALYGATLPTLAPPLTKKSRALSLNLPCSPCGKPECPFGHTKCLHDLKPEMVLAAITSII